MTERTLPTLPACISTAVWLSSASLSNGCFSVLRGAMTALNSATRCSRDRGRCCARRGAPIMREEVRLKATTMFSQPDERLLERVAGREDAEFLRAALTRLGA